MLGINAPHKNALPKATTLTIPPIASLLLTSELISKAKVNACKVNTSVFNDSSNYYRKDKKFYVGKNKVGNN